MAVHVRIPRALADDARGATELTIDLPAGSTLADLLIQMRTSHPALARRIVDETGQLRRFVNVYIGADEARTLRGLATPIPDAAQVMVVGSVAGG